MTFHECCRAILNDPRANGYARAYAKAGLNLTDPEAQRVQALYLLSNIAAWRGNNHAQVRANLKALAAKKEK